jgi:hypothetical protein
MQFPLPKPFKNNALIWKVLISLPSNQQQMNMKNPNKKSSDRPLKKCQQAIPKKACSHKQASHSITARPGGQFIQLNL